MGLTLTATSMDPGLAAGTVQQLFSEEGAVSPLKEVAPEPQSETLIFVVFAIVWSMNITVTMRPF